MSGHHKWSDIKHQKDDRLRLVEDTENGWTLHIEAATDSGDIPDQLLGDLAEAMRPYSGSVGGRTDHPRYTATFSITEPDLDAASAGSMGYELFRSLAEQVGLPEWPVVRLEVMTFAEQDRDLATP